MPPLLHSACISSSVPRPGNQGLLGALMIFPEICCPPDNWIPRLHGELGSTWKAEFPFKWKTLRASNICQNSLICHEAAAGSSIILPCCPGNGAEKIQVIASKMFSLSLGTFKSSRGALKSLLSALIVYKMCLICVVCVWNEGGWGFFLPSGHFWLKHGCAADFWVIKKPLVLSLPLETLIIFC